MGVGVVRSTVHEILDRIDSGVELGSAEAYHEAVLRAFPLAGVEAATAKRVKRYGSV